MARTMFAPGILWGCGVRLEVHGKENLEAGVPYVFASNHLSYLDIPVLFRAIPHNLHFVAKKQIKSVPFIGWYMMATGMIFVDRSDRSKAKASMQKAAQLISKGKDVLMFPEGTRSRNGAVNNFKKGAFILAQNAKVAAVPVALTGTDHVLQAGKILFRPGLVRVQIGEPMKYDHEDFQVFATACKKRVEELKDGLVSTPA